MDKKSKSERYFVNKYERGEFVRQDLTSDIDNAIKHVCDAFTHLYKLADKYQRTLQDPEFNPRRDAVLPYEVEVSAGTPVLVKITIPELLPHIWKANPFVRDNVYRALRDVWQTTFQEAAENAVEKIRKNCPKFSPLKRFALITKVYYPERAERDTDNYLVKFANDGFKGTLIFDDSYYYEPYIFCFSEEYQQQPKVEIYVKELTPEDEEFFQRFCGL